MFALYQDPIVAALRNGVPGLFTSKDLIKLGEPSLQGDNYMTSLVEQELCQGKQPEL